MPRDSSTVRHPANGRGTRRISARFAGAEVRRTATGPGAVLARLFSGRSVIPTRHFFESHIDQTRKQAAAGQAGTVCAVQATRSADEAMASNAGASG